ncbi:tRNA glutamyl-Q(34) synthetase GluQRS [Cognatishimia sp. WU-CL00825]|uniref:tRNA glutamyl-Q(34) synthetase GluQRS n=1 Tax=Cognatishimia sp. WU-CL00825 TaxID=3127658 RepID=UPI0033658E6B
MTFRTRFAPSPTGPLHLGHAYSALIAFRQAQAKKGAFLLRIEDIDQSRSRPHWEEQIYDDLQWLGIKWQRPVMRQSDRASAYKSALNQLTDMGLTYPCTCSRADIQAAASAPQEGVPQFGPDGRIYPGTCREKTFDLQDAAPVVRLNMHKALQRISPPEFDEFGPLYRGTHQLDPDHLQSHVGDIILVRRGMASSYHLSVVVDDAAQHISQVTRGADLWEATQIHVVLQTLLGLPIPRFYHHDLIRDAAGKRLAKRDDARAIATYRDAGAAPQDILNLIGL